MPTITLTFDSDEEKLQALNAIHGERYATAIVTFRYELQRKFKHREITPEQQEILDEVQKIAAEEFDHLEIAMD